MVTSEQVDGYLACLFGRSDPGQEFHQLLVAHADPAGRTALGMPTMQSSIFAIAPTQDVDAAAFVSQCIRRATTTIRESGHVIHFAGLAMEVWTVADDGTKATENRVRRLLADRKLQEHPAAVEVTQLYAACRDGRRWVGTHLLTGPRAGAVLGPQVRTGPFTPGESGPHQRLIQLAVGLRRPA